MCVLDVSDPNDVRCLTKVKVAGSREFASRITLLPNSTIALVTGSYGVDILDYADPAHTKKVTHIDPGVIDQEARTVIADHRTALVVGAFGVAILDISDPNNVRWLAKVKMGVCTRMSSNRITLIPNSTIAIVTGAETASPLSTMATRAIRNMSKPSIPKSSPNQGPVARPLSTARPRSSSATVACAC